MEFEQVRNVIVETLGCEPEQVTLEATLAEHGTCVLSHAAASTLLAHFPARRT